MFILQAYLGGAWVAPCGGCCAMHFLMKQWGWPGGLLDLMPTARPLWLVAAALLVMIFVGPAR